MGLGEFLAKVVTAPIKIVALPFVVIKDIAEAGDKGLVDIVTESIEKQIKEII